MVVLLHMCLRVLSRSASVASQFCFLLMVLASMSARSQNHFPLHYNLVDKDSSFKPSQLGLQEDFANQAGCLEYASKIPSLLQAKGFVTASLDSMYFDSTSATAWVYTGQAYQWINLATDSADKSLLSNAGWNAKNFHHNPAEAVKPFELAAELAYECNLGINAGHDLSLDNLHFFAQSVPHLLEVSIGHALITDALYYGLENTIQLYLRQLAI